MANYNPNRPRPNIDGALALPGDLPAVDPAAGETFTLDPAESSTEPLARSLAQSLATDPEPESDPTPAPASHVLPRLAEPLDGRLLAALSGTAALCAMAALLAGWLLWRRWRRR